jgi:hypothetical protein
MKIIHGHRGDHRRIAEPVGIRSELRVAVERRGVARFREGDAAFLARIGTQQQLVEAIDATADGEMVAVSGHSPEINALGPRQDGAPGLRARRVRRGKAEVDVVVVGVDPQAAMRRIDVVFTVRLPP